MDPITVRRLIAAAILACGSLACWWAAYAAWKHLLRAGYPWLDRAVALLYMLVCAVLAASFTWLATLLVSVPPE